MRSTIKRLGWIALWLLAAASAHVPGSAAAQGDPDLREILPYLMLVIDTSGSMERLPACSCTTAGCLECLPNCDLPNVNLQPPTEPPEDPEGRQLKKNRWATTLEALTGTFNDFECEALAREPQNGATYDVGYFTPYHQPWDCSTAGAACAFSSLPAAYQNSNGILDQYSTRVRFGLMTFDGMDTYVGATGLVPADTFMQNLARSNDVYGLWSYGGPKAFNYPGCTTDYMMDTGARGPQADEGSLISLNSCSGGGLPGESPTCPDWCSSCNGAQDAINRDIQEALLATRPYGGTPIAGSLDDLYFHLQNMNDDFGDCRNRFALLVTDGEPDADYRNHGCDCANDGTDADRCGGDPLDPRYNPALKKCPYPTAEQAAENLVVGRSSTEPAMIERLFVVGMAVDDPNVLARLNNIADQGCLEEEEVCDTDDDGNQALFADDLNGLVENLSAVINSLIEPISRSVPAFAPGNQVTEVKQYQISTGFEVSTDPGHPWTGVIERRRFLCADGEIVEDPLDTNEGDRFHETLNNSTSASSRNLFTMMPPGLVTGGWANDMAAMNGHLYKGPATAPCGTDGCAETQLTTSITPPNFGLGTTNDARRTEIVNWMRGDSTSVRANKKLGDIYHSSPVIVGSPRFDTADEAFNLFRQRIDVAGRPLTMYVGLNDGILHAFSVEAYATPTGYPQTRTYVAGQEMWGFVPSLLLDDVEDNLQQHTFTMDGTPLVKNVYFERDVTAQATGDQYHTVLITGMREGGRAYVALDVTNPIDPVFLWQFTDPQMGKTFGQPAIAQARYTVDVGGTSQVKQGAVAILPGGVGELGALTGECSNGTNPALREQNLSPFDTLDNIGGSPTLTHRADVRCWRDEGRALYFVEVETGILLKKIYLDPGNSNKRVFPSPLVSAPSIYPGEIGALTTQAYITDADGVIWRIDMSASNQAGDAAPQGQGTDATPMAGWTARPFHDIFFDAAPDGGELTYDAPILSVDNDGQVVVIVGTGDNNNFVKPNIRNRVVSVTEVRNPLVTSPVPERFRAAMNWEMRVTGGTTGTRLTPSELVTGTMALFNGTLFFATFQAITGADACDVGRGRIHAVHYRERGPVNPGEETYSPRLINGVGIDSAATVINVPPESAVDNLMLMGLGLTQRPACTEIDADSFDVWDQDLTSIGELANPAVYLVAQGSGNTNVGGLLQDRAGSNLGSVELQVNKPTSLSRVVSWAASVD